MGLFIWSKPKPNQTKPETRFHPHDPNRNMTPNPNHGPKPRLDSHPNLICTWTMTSIRQTMTPNQGLVWLHGSGLANVWVRVHGSFGTVVSLDQGSVWFGNLERSWFRWIALENCENLGRKRSAATVRHVRACILYQPSWQRTKPIHAGQRPMKLW